MTAPTEWRVSWRRTTWSSATATKSRIFGRETDAREFISEKLWGGDRPELGPLELVKLDRRPVGEWAEAEA